MATTTTKLSLVKPAASDIVDVSAHISNNFSTLDTSINALVCTSATRPATPYIGQLIFETDTGYVKIYHTEGLTSYWLPIGHNSWGKGFVGQTAITSNSATISGATELDTGIEVTFTAEADRQYMVELKTYTRMTLDDGTTGGFLNIRLRWASGASVGTGDTLIDSASTPVNFIATNRITQVHCQRIFAPAVSGQVTVGLFAVGASSHEYDLVANSATNLGALTVVDVAAV